MEWLNRRAVRGMIAETVRRIPRGGTFLECAAGAGEISLAAAPFTARVLCTDLSLPMLDRTRKKAAQMNARGAGIAA